MNANTMYFQPWKAKAVLSLLSCPIIVILHIACIPAMCVSLRCCCTGIVIWFMTVTLRIALRSMDMHFSWCIVCLHELVERSVCLNIYTLISHYTALLDVWWCVKYTWRRVNLLVFVSSIDTCTVKCMCLITLTFVCAEKRIHYACSLLSHSGLADNKKQTRPGDTFCSYKWTLIKVTFIYCISRVCSCYNQMMVAVKSKTSWLASDLVKVWSDVPKTTRGIHSTEVTLCFTVSATGWQCAVIGLNWCRLSSSAGLNDIFYWC